MSVGKYDTIQMWSLLVSIYHIIRMCEDCVITIDKKMTRWMELTHYYKLKFILANRASNQQPPHL